ELLVVLRAAAPSKGPAARVRNFVPAPSLIEAGLRARRSVATAAPTSTAATPTLRISLSRFQAGGAQKIDRAGPGRNIPLGVPQHNILAIVVVVIIRAVIAASRCVLTGPTIRIAAIAIGATAGSPPTSPAARTTQLNGLVVVLVIIVERGFN